MQKEFSYNHAISYILLAEAAKFLKKEYKNEPKNNK